MKRIKYILFRYITPAEYKHIYKPPKTEKEGGGQSYIDISTAHFNMAARKKFFKGFRSRNPKGYQSWEIRINSIGVSEKEEQVVQMSLRRASRKTIKIDNQKLDSSESNRVYAWHPGNGFPKPKDPSKKLDKLEDLAVFIVRTEDGEFWAGWFRDRVGKDPCRDDESRILLQNLIHNQEKGNKKNVGYCGFLEINSLLCLDINNKEKPFYFIKHANSQVVQVPLTGGAKNNSIKKSLEYATPSEGKIIKALFNEDRKTTQIKITEKIKKIVIRNQKAAKDLKKLYRCCQITGTKHIFIQKNKKPYTEIHHLIPLGEGGADAPHNLIVISPLIHRMIHYANVSGIDLNNIKNNQLEIKINDKKYTIRWHKEHAKHVMNVTNKSKKP